jgi:CHASE3 domain sensor protein
LPDVKPEDMVGKQLFDDFEPLAVTSLQIVKYDEATGTPSGFEVSQVNNRWSIPSHSNYPTDAKDQLAEAAASVRGYLLTRREDFLPGYLKAKPLIESALRRLDSNVRDERVRAQLTAITPLINSKVDGLEQMLSDREAKPESITTILINNKYILDELREHISTMLTLEDTLLAERTAAAYATRQRLLFSTLLAALCGLFGAIVAVLFLSKGIVARVQQVQGNAQRLALGQPLRPQPPENDEIGQLGTRLVEAGLLLAERERALRDNEERLRLIIDGVKDYGIFALDTRGYVTSWNAGCRGQRSRSPSHRDLCPRHPGLCHQLERRRRADQGLHGTGNHRPTLLGVLSGARVPAASRDGPA